MGLTLGICSSDNIGYVTAIADKSRFYTLFDEIWYAVEGSTKTQAVGMLKEKYNTESFIMLGDRSSDMKLQKRITAFQLALLTALEKMPLWKQMMLPGISWRSKRL